jgi:hypothetical protein
MHCIATGRNGYANNFIDAQVSLERRFAATNAIGLDRLEAVQCKPVFRRINGNAWNIQLMRGAHYANCDFAAIGDENFIEKRFQERRPSRRLSLALDDHLATAANMSVAGFRRVNGSTFPLHHRPVQQRCFFAVPVLCHRSDARVDIRQTQFAQC